LGAFNIVFMPWIGGHSSAFLGAGPIFNVLLFVVPGLILCGIGARLGGRNDSAPQAQAEPVVATPGEATKTCPQCAETVKAAARIYRFCRYEFPAQPESLQSAPEVPRPVPAG